MIEHLTHLNQGVMASKLTGAELCPQARHINFHNTDHCIQICAPKHGLWALGEAVLTCNHNLCFEQK